MAFFGLTHLGYQDTIREHVKNPSMTPQEIFRSGLYRESGKVFLPPIDKKDLLQPSIVPINQTSGYGPGPVGSFVERKRMRIKHIRDPKETVEIYRYPYATTSAQIGQWRIDEPLNERQPWTHVKRHPMINSEMTRFVKDMGMTNREFSLY